MQACRRCTPPNPRCRWLKAQAPLKGRERKPILDVLKEFALDAKRGRSVNQHDDGCPGGLRNRRERHSVSSSEYDASRIGDSAGAKAKAEEKRIERVCFHAVDDVSTVWATSSEMRLSCSSALTALTTNKNVVPSSRPEMFRAFRTATLTLVLTKPKLILRFAEPSRCR